jgi:DNA-binding beta-propeller fold protein YncE
VSYGNTASRVAVINDATCNGTHTVGCGRHFPTMPTGPRPLSIAIDTRTEVLYVTDFTGATVSVLNGVRFNAVVTSGCARAGHAQAVGSGPRASRSASTPAPST